MYYNNYYDYPIDDFFTNNMSDALVGGLAIFFIIVLIIVALIALVMSILGIIGMWKTLEKAHKPGWGALIPFYNSYLLCEASGVNPMWILAMVIISALGFVIPSVLSIIHIFGFIQFGIKGVLSLLSLASSLYFSILLGVSVSKSFGKSEAFAVGLVLLPPIFYFILGIGDAKYQGANPMHDVVFETLNKNFDMGAFGSFESTTEAKGTYVKKCPYCGSKTAENSKFCSVCGSKIN